MKIIIDFLPRLKKKYGVSFFVLFWLFMPVNLKAQSIGFLPPNVWSFSVAASHIQSENVFRSGLDKETLLHKKLDQENIEDGAVSGSIIETTVEQKLLFQYGLSYSINLGIKIPFISRERDSNLTPNNAQNEQAANFVEQYGNAEMTGMGDLELWGSWRILYTDQTDFQLGFALNGENGSYAVDQKSEISLGNGTVDYIAFLRWIFFPMKSSISIHLELTEIGTKYGTIENPEGQELKIRRGGNGTEGFISLSTNSGFFNYGGGFIVVSRAGTVIDHKSQADGFLSYASHFFINLGNLYRLEEETFSWPWEFQFDLKKTIGGNNAAEETGIALMVTTYF